MLKEFKDDDIQGNLEFNAYGAKMDKIEEGKEQDWSIDVEMLSI